MKKFKLRNLVAVCLAVALLGGALTVFSLANGNQPTVTYDHKEKGFIFDNVTKVEGNEYPNLFTELAELMPGDSRDQDIRVQVKNLTSGTAYMYLRTEDMWVDKPQEITQTEADAYAALMEQITLTVKQGDKVLAEGDLSKGVLLGKLRSNDKVEVPLEMGNEFQNFHGEIGWVFTAEYHNDPVKPVGPPALSSVDHYAYMVGYPDGMVHPEKQITRAETATIFFRMLTDESREDYWSQVNPYYDVLPEDWFNNAVSTLTNAGILNGYPDGNFAPNGNITRAEFAAMAVRFFTDEEEDVKGDSFPDIADHWANYEINLAYAKDIIEGYPDGTFKPDQEITRAEAVTIVNRVLERYPHKEYLLEDMIVWPDNMDETMWYYEDIQEATNSHVFDREYDEDKVPYEIWTELLPVRDWVALEREWSDYNSSHNPGEVVSSRTAAVFKD